MHDRSTLILSLLLAAQLLSGCASLKKPPAAPTPPATPPAAATPAPLPTLPNEPAHFIDEMVAAHGFDRAALEALFAKVQTRERIIEIMTTPAEAKPWYKYRPIFITGERIRGGVEFWRENAAALARAEREYGVPAEIIVAIIGVETRYGGNMGGFPVIDALATLAFHYPPRAPFFRSELEEFLLLAREERLDPLAPKGSYAGAMGEAQFMPSSYRKYSVDFDGDGRRDLWTSSGDAIGSVARYLNAHGWQRGQPITTRARVYGTDYRPLLEQGPRKPELSIAQLKDYGVVSETCLDNAQRALLLRLETGAGDEFWLGLDNFYTITRYNHSHRYAMAVYQLSQEILARH